MNLLKIKTQSMGILNGEYRLSKLKKLQGQLSKKTTQALLKHVKNTRLEWSK